MAFGLAYNLGDFSGLAMSTYGPAYNEELDGERIATQLDVIKHFMLAGGWRTLKQISLATRAPEASASAQLRHLKKSRFGGYDVQKRRKNNGWEYRVNPPVAAGQLEVF